jgi:uncharacterized protein YndB with AHSA1/START domain
MITPVIQVYETFIRTASEELWRALLDPELTQKYFFGTLVRTEAKKGAAIIYTFPDGSPCIDGEILEYDPPRTLSHTWIIRYSPELAEEKSVVTWTIEPRGECCKLTVTHELSAAPKSAKHVATDGWSVVLSGLKTLLETGKPLAIARVS